MTQVPKWPSRTETAAQGGSWGFGQVRNGPALPLPTHSLLVSPPPCPESIHRQLHLAHVANNKKMESSPARFSAHFTQRLLRSAMNSHSRLRGKRGGEGKGQLFTAQRTHLPCASQEAGVPSCPFQPPPPPPARIRTCK